MIVRTNPRTRCVSIVVCFLGAALASQHAEAAPAIINLGAMLNLPGLEESGAYEFSPDGQYVIGSDNVEGAWRWSEASGFDRPPYAWPDGFASVGYHFESFPTQRFAQHSRVGGLTTVIEPSAAVGVTHPQTFLAGYPSSGGNVLSADGTTVAGYSGNVGGRSTQWEQFAFRWTEGSGRQDLPSLDGDIYSRAASMSLDGSRIVGSSYNGYSSPFHAVLWDGDTPIALTPGMSSIGGAISGDGQTVFGNPYATNGSLGDLFRWTEAEGIVDLGVGFDSERLVVSVDGSRFISKGSQFMWDQALGAVSVPTYLASHGVDLSGWYLDDFIVYDMTGDGLSFCGFGLNTAMDRLDAWVVTIPAPGSLAALGVCGVFGTRRHRPTCTFS